MKPTTTTNVKTTWEKTLNQANLTDDEACFYYEFAPESGIYTNPTITMMEADTVDEAIAESVKLSKNTNDYVMVKLWDIKKSKPTIFNLFNAHYGRVFD